MAEVQPRNVRDATETANRVFFICATFLVRFEGLETPARLSGTSLSPGRRLTVGLAVLRPRRGGHLFREQDELLDDRRDAGKELRRDGGQTIDQRFQMAEVAEVIRQEIARLFAECFSDLDEVLEIQPALTRFEASQVRRRHRDTPGDAGLAAGLRFPEPPEDLS